MKSASALRQKRRCHCQAKATVAQASARVAVRMKSDSGAPTSRDGKPSLCGGQSSLDAASPRWCFGRTPDAARVAEATTFDASRILRLGDGAAPLGKPIASAGMGDAEREWNDRDAWLLVAMPSRPGPLRKLFFIADGIEKDVPTHEELNAALRRFIAAGLVSRQDDEFALSADGRELVRQARARGVYTQIDAVRSALRARGMAPELPPWELVRSDYDAQLQGYHDDFERLSIPLRRLLVERLRRIWKQDRH